MGVFSVPVTICSMERNDLFFRADFIVDTGAVFSSAPESKLREIGVTPVEFMRFKLANGAIEERGVTDLLFGINGSTLKPCPMIFGAEGSPCLLGATALERFGFATDSYNKKLVPVVGLLCAMNLRVSIRSGNYDDY